MWLVRCFSLSLICICHKMCNHICTGPWLISFYWKSRSFKYIKSQVIYIRAGPGSWKPVPSVEAGKGKTGNNMGTYHQFQREPGSDYSECVEMHNEEQNPETIKHLVLLEMLKVLETFDWVFFIAIYCWSPKNLSLKKYISETTLHPN